MNLLLAFAPFIAFAVVDRLVGSVEGLVAGAAVSVALLLRDALTPGRSPKILEIGSAVLFAGLAAYALFAAPDWSVMAVRLRVDVGLLAIVLVSLAIGKPFTLQYAKEGVDPQHWNSPVFLRTNRVITAVWALAFMVLVAADLLILYVPQVPHQVGIVATILALVAAFKFTSDYPRRVRERSP